MFKSEKISTMKKTKQTKNQTKHIYDLLHTIIV